MIDTDEIYLSDRKFSINQSLEKIWADYYGTEELYNPISAIYPNGVIPDSLMFLSLNPSLQPKNIGKAKRGNSPAPPYPNIDWRKEKADYIFFQKFYEIGKKFGSWSILDLLYIRETKQKKIEAMFYSKDVNRNERKFIQEQIKLTFEILRELKPKVVVVSNSLTDKLIHSCVKNLGITQEFPANSNKYIYKLNSIPFITNESKFLGSRIHSYNYERRKKLTEEISRVLKNCP